MPRICRTTNYSNIVFRKILFQLFKSNNFRWADESEIKRIPIYEVPLAFKIFARNYFFFSVINYPIEWQNADIPLELTISEYEIAKPRYQLSNSLDSTKNILSSHTEEVIKATLNFNAGDNIIILDGQANTYRGLEGDDTYFVSQLLPKNGKFQNYKR